jgi:hypothetical protein
MLLSLHCCPPTISRLPAVPITGAHRSIAVVYGRVVEELAPRLFEWIDIAPTPRRHLSCVVESGTKAFRLSAHHESLLVVSPFTASQWYANLRDMIFDKQVTRRSVKKEFNLANV